MVKRALSLLLAALMLLGMLPVAFAEGEPEQIAATEEPIAAEEPIMEEEPVEAEEPIVAEEPAAAEEPIAAEEPAAAEEPIMAEEPAAAEEPIVIEEPAVAEEPAEQETAPEPEAPAAPVEEPAAEEVTAGAEAEVRDANSGTCGKDVTWSLSADGTMTISGKGKMDDYADDENVPWRAVRSSIKKLVVESGVTSIGCMAFYMCENLTSVSLPKGLTSIGNVAFSYNYALSAIELPDGLVSIGHGAISHTSIKSVTIPGSVTNMEDAFFENTGLTTVVIKSGVTVISKGAFDYCYNLVNVTIPDTVTEICSFALSRNGFTSIKIPDSVTKIGEMAFIESNLTSVDIPYSVTSIGMGAFGMGRLTKITVNNPNCKIEDDKTEGDTTIRTLGDDAAIYGYAGSTAQDYAKKYDRKFVALGGLPAPKLSKVSNTSTGVKITWGKVTGAAKYRVYYKTGKGGWTKIKDVTGTSYTWTGAKVNTKYSFTVKAFDKNKVGGDYDKTGKSITFYKLKTPAAPKVSNAATGVKITWEKISGAAKYRVYYKVGTGKWTKIGDTTKTSYTWPRGESGTKYSFTIRCVTSNGKSYTSDYDAKGSSITYIAAPKISKVQNTATGVQITWGAVNGAGCYRVFYKVGTGKWTKIANTTKTSYTWTKAKSGTKYSFTIRCMNKDGEKYTSSYDGTGKSITYIATPKLSKVKNAATGVQITWGAVKGAAKYRVFYKNGGGKWTKAGDTTDTSYIWTKAKSGMTYSFTVRCLNGAGKSYTSDYDHEGKSIQYYAAPKIEYSFMDGEAFMMSWLAVPGVSDYQVFYRTRNTGWKKLDVDYTNPYGEGVYYASWGGTDGVDYAFTVRCVDSNGKYLSGYYDIGQGYVEWQTCDYHE